MTVMRYGAEASDGEGADAVRDKARVRAQDERGIRECVDEVR